MHIGRRSLGFPPPAGHVAISMHLRARRRDPLPDERDRVLAVIFGPRG